MKTISKRYKKAQELVDQSKLYSLKEALAILKKAPTTKFDESVDVAINLNIDPKKPEQLIRGTVSLPHGTGKKIKVAVFCKGEAEKEAQAAGADIVGSNELIDKVAGGFLDFDCAIATPEMMKDLAKLGKLLGPRGLMPSPKAGTVTNNVAQTVKEIKQGKIEYKVDKQGGIHNSVGRISFDENKLYENAHKFIETIGQAKPSSVKGQFVTRIAISKTMGPGLKLSL